MRKKETMTYENYNTPVRRNTDSDESDSDEMLPIGAFWPAPEEEIDNGGKITWKPTKC